MNAEKISGSSLFRGLSRTETESILKCLSAVERRYPKDALILCAGDSVSSVGLVLEGRVEVIREDYWGNRQILSVLEPGELFGESYACSGGEPLMVSVQASESCAVLFLEVQRILTTCSPACEYHSRLVRNLLSVLAEKNLALTRKIDHMGQRTIREKVMAYLSDEAQKQKKDELVISFNRKQLADYLAVDRSALSAELSRMQQAGIIRYEKNRFTIERKQTWTEKEKRGS